MRHVLKMVLVLILAGMIPLQANAAGLALDELGEGEEDDFLAEIASEDEEEDLDLLRISHLSEVERWSGVAGRRSRERKAWKAVSVRGYRGRTFAAPVGDGAARALIRVPEDGTYRIWLGQVISRDGSRPVRLALGRANELSLTFGKLEIDSRPGKKQEQEGSFRFDSHRERMSAPMNQAAMVWEYRGAELAAGETLFELRSKSRAARLDAVFLSRSTDFDPSKAALRGNLNRTFYRFRVAEGEDGETVRIGERLTYHRRHSPPGYDEPLWYSSLSAFEPDHRAGPITSADGQALVPVGTWSRWIDATGAVTAPGSYATSRISFSGIRSGTAEVQIAWTTHPAAVMRTVRPGIQRGVATCMIPLDRGGYTAPVAKPDAEGGAWGMRPRSYLERLETAADVHERHFAWAEDAIEKLGAGAQQPTPKRIRLYTSFRPAPAATDRAARMLKTLGLNWLAAPMEIREKYDLWPDHALHYNDALYYAGTHCPTDPMIGPNYRDRFEKRARGLEKGQEDARRHVRLLKMGDEIGAITSSTHVNRCSDCRAAFHRYLHQKLDEMGEDASFFGVSDVRELSYDLSLPANPGRYQRRLYYHCQQFKFYHTALFYRTMTGAAEEVFPNVRTYCNFSPHPPMFGGDMNHSDWFKLTRLGGASMAWGEDWATGGSWGMAGIQTVSYYAAWVECAARVGDLPSGFYNVASCGRPGRKMFSLLAHGVRLQQIYSWGPHYAGAEGSNFWSENPGVYRQVARATHALGPADRIVAEGTRPQRRVGLLYNRSHEIWNAGAGGYQTDRLLTFLALQHAHLPTDILIEEDLTSERLRPYRVLYVQGHNLAPRRVEVLREWVEDGGVLVGIAGTALRDTYDEPMNAAESLFGARQRVVGRSQGGWHAMRIPRHEPIDTVRFAGSELTPELEAGVVGVQAVLEPTDGRAVARYSEGSGAAVERELGEGRTLLLGVMPGLLYAHNAPRKDRLPTTYTKGRRMLVARPALRTVGRPRVEYSEPLTEICLFEHESGLAVTLNDFSYAPGREATLRVETDRDVTEVTSTVRGALEWEREGDRIIVQCPVPEAVDVVILR